MIDKSLLSGTSILSEINGESLEEIARKCEVLECEPQHTVFRQEESATKLFGLLAGEIELVFMFKDRVLKTDIEYEESILSKYEILERPLVIDTVGPGEVFGWSSLVVPHGRWTATARCSKRSRLFFVDADHLRSMFDRNPALGYLFMTRLGGIMSQRLEQWTAKLIEAWGQAFEVHEL